MGLLEMMCVVGQLCLGVALHAGDFNAPKALERCHPALQSGEKWALAAILANYIPLLKLLVP